MPKRPVAPVARAKSSAGATAPTGSRNVAAADAKLLATLELVAEDYASASRADSTVDTYVKHWNAFSAWCAAHGCTALPASAQTLMLYLAARADECVRPATLSVTLSAISYEHERADHPSPTDDPKVKKTWRGIRRRLGTASQKKAPLSAAELRRMIDALPPGLTGLRDRAMILVGFAGGFRRSELVALQHAHLRFVREGLEVLVERSKTDQERRGHVKVIAFGSDPESCPVRALSDWLALSGIRRGGALPADQSARSPRCARADRPRRSGDHQATRGGRGSANARAFWTFTARRVCYRRCKRRRRLSVDHGSDRTRKLEHRARLQPTQGQVEAARERKARVMMSAISRSRHAAISLQASAANCCGVR